jgi:hypothetical protein
MKQDQQPRHWRKEAKDNWTVWALWALAAPILTGLVIVTILGH